MPEKQDYTFDLSKLRARDLQSFLKAAGSNDYDAVAGVLARVVTGGLPGDLADAETYLDLPYQTWSALLKAFSDEVAGKN